MSRPDPWIFHASPLPHLRLQLGPQSTAHVVLTTGDWSRRPDLGYAPGGGASSARERRHLAAALGVEPARLAFMEQVHGGRVAVIDEAQAGAGVADRGSAMAGADAMISGTAGLALVGLSADCPLVALWDEGGRWIALAHAGWRGLAAGVLGSTVAGMVAQGVKAEDVRAAIGAHIGWCCYEVKEDVIAALVGAGRGRAEHIRRDDRQLTYLDLQAVVRYQLTEAGVKAEAIVGHPLCTCCEEKLFHSYRRDGAAAGRQALAIRLRGR